MKPRLVIAIVSTIIEEVAIALAVLWGLPEIGINIPVWIVVVIMIAWASYAVYTYRKGTVALGVGHIMGLPNMIGTRGKVITELNPEGMVKINGELWTARSTAGQIKPGIDIIVTDQKRLKLEVSEGISDDNGESSQ